MSKKLALALPALGVLGIVILLTPAGELAAQEIRQVFVTNFPVVQRIEGSVSVAEPVPLTEMVRIEGVIVPPVKPSETTRLVDAGLLKTAGFPGVVLSLHGVVKGEVAKSGEVGALLIPDEPTVQQAFDELGLIHFPLEVTAPFVSVKTPYFASNQNRYTVGFESYRVYLYNTTDKTVTASVFAYLTN